MYDWCFVVCVGEFKFFVVCEFFKYSKLFGVILFGGGILVLELFDIEGLELVVQKVMSECFNDVFQYGLMEGYLLLCQVVSEICYFCGVVCLVVQVYIIFGFQ